jgi:hypothetical protein
VLRNSIGSNVIIPLNNQTINPKDVFVLSNTAADNQLQLLSDMLNQNLRFDQHVALDLQNNDVTIDNIGENINTSGTFNFAQFQNDPVSYLQSSDLNLEDFNNFGLRRNFFVSSGNPSFQSIDLNQYWIVTLNTDRSDIGSHISTCNKPEGVNTIGYKYQSVTLKKCFGHPELNNYPGGYMIELNYDITTSNNSSPSYWVGQLLHSLSSGCVSKDLSEVGSSTWNGNDPNNDIAWIYSLFSAGNQSITDYTYEQKHQIYLGSGTLGTAYGIYVLNNGRPDCSSTLTLSGQFNASNYDKMIINVKNDCGVLSTNEEKLMDISVYPTLLKENNLIIETPEKSSYEVFSFNGQRAAEGELLQGYNKIKLNISATGLYYLKLKIGSNCTLRKITIL